MGRICCEKCGKRCIGDVLRVSNRYYHQDCFRCCKCQKCLEKGGFFERDGQFYCPTDYRVSFGARCHVCSKPLLEDKEAVSALQLSFHRQCFRCFHCGRYFQPGDRVTRSSSHFFCKTCVPTSSTTNGEHHQNGRPPQAPYGSHNPPSEGWTWNTDTGYESGSSTQGGYTSARETVLGGGVPRGTSQDDVPEHRWQQQMTRTYLRLVQHDKPLLHQQLTVPSSPSNSSCCTPGSHSPIVLPHFHQPIVSRGGGATSPVASRIVATPLASLARPAASVSPKLAHLQETSGERRGGGTSPGHQPSRATSGLRVMLRKPHLHMANNSLVGNKLSPVAEQAPTPWPNSEDPQELAEAALLQSVWPSGHPWSESGETPPIERRDWPAPPEPALAYWCSEEIREQRSRQRPSRVATRGPNHLLAAALPSPDSNSGMSGAASPSLSSCLFPEENDSLATDSQAGGLLDPVSSSRCPSADTEPERRTRYVRHRFASPSRDLQHDREHYRHRVGFSTNYVNLPSRQLSGTPIQMTSCSTPAINSMISVLQSYDEIRHNYVDSLLENCGMVETSATSPSGVSKAVSLPVRSSADQWPKTSGSIASEIISRQPEAPIGQSFSSSMSILLMSSGRRITSPLPEPWEEPDDSVVTSAGPNESFTDTGTVDYRGLRRSRILERPQPPRQTHNNNSQQARICNSLPPGVSIAGGRNAVPLPPVRDVPGGPAHTARQSIPYEELKKMKDSKLKHMDKNQLETLLSEMEFVRVFGMNRNTFYILPEWKRNDLKRRVGLYS